MAKHSIRLPGFDYRHPGPYFLTLVVDRRRPILATRQDHSLTLTPAGRIVEEEWQLLATRRPGIQLDEFVIMPDHFHAIILLPDSRALPAPNGHSALYRPPKSLGAIVAQFKAGTTRRINAIQGTGGRPLWQRNYYEHIVRNAHRLNRIRRYIQENPSRP